MRTARFAVILALLLSLFLPILAAGDPPEKSGMITVNGTELYYHTIGEGEPILILHGGPGLNHTYFLPQMAGLAKNHTLIFFDQRATGRSSMAVDTGTVNMKSAIEDIEGMRQAFKLGKMNLLGHSFGGLLAMEYAITYPENLRSLTLANTAAASSKLRMEAFWKMEERTTREDSIAKAAIMASEAFERKEPAAIAAFFRAQFTADFYDRKFRDSITLSFDENYAKTAMLVRGLNRDVAKFDIHEALKAITCPTLIIQSDRDRTVPEAFDRIHKNIPHSRVALIEHCGHFPFIEKPAEFFRIVSEFVAKPDSR